MGVFKGFTQMGGIISCYRVRGKLKLEINIDAARGSGFEFSSDLLALARLTKDPENT
ncbi:MAG: YfiR family protein [Desulfobacteraceae bacterium]|nr:YfiR family protein [Desulfobacteraceae bacterium]